MWRKSFCRRHACRSRMIFRNRTGPAASFPRRRRQMPTPERAAATTGAILNLLQEALQAIPQKAGSAAKLVLDEDVPLDPLPSANGPQRAPRNDDVATARTITPPPPFRGALPSAQPVVPPSLAPDTPLAAAVHHLLDDTDAAIARQTLLQVASLPDRADIAGPRTDPAAPRWNFEIPFATPAGTAIAQFEISRDGTAREIDAAKRVWRARFSLDVEPAGPVHALISLSGDKTSVRMWAERPATATQLRAGASQLSQALSRAELQPGDIVIRDGAPLQSSAGARRAFSGSRAMSVETKSQLAVALHYDKSGAPRVVAKGRGTIGEKIIEVAKAHDIPIEENEVLAGALSNVELGDEIPAELYKAVAEVLIFVLRLSGESARISLIVVIVLPRCPAHRCGRSQSHRCCLDQSPPHSRSSRRRRNRAVARFRQRRATAQRNPRRPRKAVRGRGHGRHLRRLQDRRLSDHRQRQGPLGAGVPAGVDLQDSEFADRAGNRRGRRSRQGRVQVGRRQAQHRGVESGPHPAFGDRRLRGAGVSGNRAPHRRGADAEIRRSVRIRQSQYRRRHRSVLADRRLAHRSDPADRFRRSSAARRAAGLESAARIWSAISSR